MVGARSRVVAGFVVCFLLVGFVGGVGEASATSSAGALWRQFGAKEAGFPRRAQLNAAIADRGRLYATGAVEQDGALWTSTDGRSWEQIPVRGATGRQLGSIVRFRDVLVLATRYQADGEAPRLWTSPDGATWTRVLPSPFESGDEIYGMAATRHRLVAVGTNDRDPGGDARVWTSSVGRDWIRVDLPAELRSLTNVTAVHDGFVALGDADERGVWRSTNGRVWSRVPGVLPERLGTMVASRDGRRVLAIQYEDQESFGGRLWSSRDGGGTWTEIRSFAERFPNGSPDHITQMSWGWLLSGNKGTADGYRRRDIWWTPDLEHWQELPARLQGDVGSGYGTAAVAHAGSAIAFGLWSDRMLWSVTPTAGLAAERVAPEPVYEPRGVVHLPTAESIAGKGPEWAAVATGCHLQPGSVPGWTPPGGGSPNYDVMPRWIGVWMNRALVGCTPRELLFPELDHNAALDELGALAFGTPNPVQRPPLPVYAKDGALIAWIVNGAVPREQAESAGMIPTPLLANPPTAAQYEQNPK